MSHCNSCNKDTPSEEGKYKDLVQDKNGEWLDVYVYSCSECGTHKSDESYVE